MKQSFWRKRIHPAWLIAVFSASSMSGIALAGHVNPTLFAGTENIVIATALFIASLIKHRRFVIIIALLAGTIFGLWRGSIELIKLQEYNQYYNKTLDITGTVSDDTTYGKNGDQRLRLRSIIINNTDLPSVVWVSLSENSDIKRGDKLVIRGKLSNGFGTIPASVHQAEILNIIRPNPGDVARVTRDWFVSGVRRAIPEPEASLSVGYLVGQKSALPELLNEQLRIVGLTHVVVASGYNLTILVSFARRRLAKYSKYLATISAVTLVVSFVLITGFSPSMTRAGLVALLGLLTWYYGRTFHPVVMLLFAANITAVWRPSYVWGDIGWYLSFTAFTGVIILSPLLQRYFWGKSKKIGILKQTLLDTTSAQLLTLPIILYTFGQYATYALLANALVLPLVPLVMMLTFFAGLGGVILPSLAVIIGYPARVLLALNIFVIGWVSKLPGSHGDIKFGVIALASSYLLLLICMFYLWRKTKYNFRQSDDL